MIDHARLIAALRDTAEKATATIEVEVPDFAAEMSTAHFNRRDPITRTEHREVHSKDWIAGRLIGMADTLEALADPQSTPRVEK